MSLNQFVVSLFSISGDVDEFINIIENNKFNDRNITYNYLKKHYNKVCKFKTATLDYPDVVLRMLRITGFINIEYSGIQLITLNESKLNEKVVLSNKCITSRGPGTAYDFGYCLSEVLFGKAKREQLQKEMVWGA